MDDISFRSQHGFANNLETYGLISGLWTSTFAFGAFIGPSIAGMLYDIVGFGMATVFVIVLSAVVVSTKNRNGFVRKNVINKNEINARVYDDRAKNTPDE